MHFTVHLLKAKADLKIKQMKVITHPIASFPAKLMTALPIKAFSL